MPDIVFSVTSRRFFDQSAIVTFGQTLIARLMTRNLIFYLFGNQCVSTASFLNSETCLLTKMLPRHTFKMKPNLWIQPHFYHAAIERFLKQFRSKIVSVNEWLIGNTCNFLARLLISFMHDSLSAMIIWSKSFKIVTFCHGEQLLDQNVSSLPSRVCSKFAKSQFKLLLHHRANFWAWPRVNRVQTSPVSES